MTVKPRAALRKRRKTGVLRQASSTTMLMALPADCIWRSTALALTASRSASASERITAPTGTSQFSPPDWKPWPA
jgi:hypothetical protein